LGKREILQMELKEPETLQQSYQVGFIHRFPQVVRVAVPGDVYAVVAGLFRELGAKDGSELGKRCQNGGVTARFFCRQAHALQVVVAVFGAPDLVRPDAEKIEGVRGERDVWNQIVAAETALMSCQRQREHLEAPMPKIVAPVTVERQGHAVDRFQVLWFMLH